MFDFRRRIDRGISKSWIYHQFITLMKNFPCPYAEKLESAMKRSIRFGIDLRQNRAIITQSGKSREIGFPDSLFDKIMRFCLKTQTNEKLFNPIEKSSHEVVATNGFPSITFCSSAGSIDFPCNVSVESIDNIRTCVESHLFYSVFDS